MPGEHQQHGRLVRAGGEDHLALGADRLAHAVRHGLDADGAVALEDDPLDEDARAHLEVRAVGDGVEERVRRAAAQAVALRELPARDALRPVDAQILDQLVARLDGRFQLRVDERAHRAAVGHGHRPADAVERVRAALVVLRALEVRQHLVVRPAGAAVLGPAVEVGAVAAEVDHRVDRARAADHAAAREVEAPVAEAGLLLAVEVPVEARLHREGEQRRDVELVRRVRRPASSSSTLASGSSLRRPARTQPAVPAPTMT